MSTDVKSLTRNARMSPKKVREITRVIQGMPATEALDMVNLIPRKSARLVAKTLKSAIANAENNKNLSSDVLVVSSAVVELGHRQGIRLESMATLTAYEWAQLYSSSAS